MKRIVTLAALMLCLTSSFAQDGKSIYQKYSDSEGVRAVYVSPALFRIFKAIPEISVEGQALNLSSIIRSLSGLYVIESENAAATAELKKDAEKFVSSGKYELLMEAKENGATTRTYTVGTEEIVNSLVMISAEPDKTTFFCLDGQMNREDLENLIAEQANK